MKNINQILNQQAELTKIDRTDFENIKNISQEFVKDLEKKLKKKKIDAQVFIGGSLAKNTMVKKNKYDVDVFVRFSNKYNENEISRLLGKVLGKKAKKVHGSRDYYQVIEDSIIIEIIPVLKITKPNQAKNVMDLSYFHVNYVVKKINQNKKLADEIRLAKTFAHANDCYGAESYIQGFSGYGLELLILHYKSFLKMAKEFSKTEIAGNSADANKSKIIIDDKKHYKNKQEILIELNESKLNSPVILIDPTFKQRNALASLNSSTFSRFKESCKKFLKNPGNGFFEKKDIKELLKKKYGRKMSVICIKTNKQAGDIAGTKSRKFFRFFTYKLKKEFEINKSEFDYNDKKNTAYFYLVLEKKRDEVIKGPPVTAVNNLIRFKKSHKNAFIKNHFAYAKIKHNLNFKKWILKFKANENKIIKDMSIKEIKMI